MAKLLKGKILLGHALKNDLDVLMLSHPRSMIRDTATYRPYMRVRGELDCTLTSASFVNFPFFVCLQPHGRGGGKMKPRALRDLTKQHLSMTIQTGEHDPVRRGDKFICTTLPYLAIYIIHEIRDKMRGSMTVTSMHYTDERLYLC